MKKVSLIIALLITVTHMATGQSIRLNGYAGYVFDDSFDSYYDVNNYYNGKLKGGLQWGIGAEYMLQDVYGIELLYLRQDTKAPTQYYDAGVKNTDFDVALNYILLSGNRYFKPFNKMTPYGGLMAGIAIFNLDNPDNGRNTSATKFAWGAKLGLQLSASERIGFKVQANLLSAVQGAGGGFYFGTGGVGTGLTTYSTLYQFGLGGAVVLRLGHGATKK